MQDARELALLCAGEVVWGVCGVYVGGSDGARSPWAQQQPECNDVDGCSEQPPPTPLGPKGAADPHSLPLWCLYGGGGRVNYRGRAAAPKSLEMTQWDVLGPRVGDL